MPDPRLGFDRYTSEGDFYRDDSPEQQRIDEQRDFAFGGGLLKGITELPLDIMEFLSPEDEYNPGALAPDQSSARQRIRTERLHGEQFYDELKSDPITKQAAEVGYGASMVVDPVLDTGVLMAPHLLKGLNAIRKGEKPAIKLADLMTDEVGAVGDINEAARLQRAKDMGFDTNKTYYHGGFSDFQEFDPRRSGSGAYHFTEERNFAEDYASTKSQDSALDADIVVRPFHLKGEMFDPQNEEHIRQLAEVMPEEFGYSSGYGWGFSSGDSMQKRSDVLKELMGIQKPHVGISDKDIEAIRGGSDRFTKDGSLEMVVGYDPKTDVVEYAPGWEVDGIKRMESNIEAMTQTLGNDYWEIPQMKMDLKKKKDKLRTYKKELNPEEKAGFDNWRIMESEEIRPYLEKIGFKGAIASERGKQTAMVFNPSQIRSTTAKFDPTKGKSADIMATAAGASLGLSAANSGEPVPEVLNK